LPAACRIGSMLCACGCGQEAGVYRKASVRGQPRKFVHGHNRRRYHEVPEEMVCRSCDQVLPADAFYSDPQRPTGLSSECRECRKASVVRWNEQNPEKSAANRRKAVLASRARAVGIAAKPGDLDPQVVFDRAGGCCSMCGEALPEKGWHLDHIVPLSQGGAHSYDNAQPLHSSCHGRKSMADRLRGGE
jgi:5-methylcytosine-specific restriction endonuclease McrA